MMVLIVWALHVSHSSQTNDNPLYRQTHTHTHTPEAHSPYTLHGVCVSGYYVCVVRCIEEVLLVFSCPLGEYAYEACSVVHLINM